MTFAASPAQPRPRPLSIDPWVASSLLQKAIRRGDVDLAERAAFTLSRHRGQGIWRRLIAIAFEDVGVGSVDALIQTTTACTTAAWRLRAGGDELALRIVVRRLAEAPKDRSADHLICAAHDHPTLEEDRREVGAMSPRPAHQMRRRDDLVSAQASDRRLVRLRRRVGHGAPHWSRRPGSLDGHVPRSWRPL